MTTTPAGGGADGSPQWGPVRELLRPLDVHRTRRTVLLDLLLFAVLAVTVLPNLIVTGIGDVGFDAAVPEIRWSAAVGYVGAWLGVLAAIVAVNRSRPQVSAAASFLCTLVLPTFLMAVLVMCYLAGRRTVRTWTSVVWFLLALLAGAVTLAFEAEPLDSVPSAVALVLCGVVLPWLMGNYRRQRQELMFAGWQRAKQAEREGRMHADDARLRERARIAQDMHDSLGHELSLIALRAGALELAKDLDERHRESAGELRAGAVTATDRLREIIGVLRDESDPVPREPADEGIAAMVERAHASGVDVRLAREGDEVDLGPMADRAAYRVVQEGLTNATKHAPGAAVQVRVRGGDQGVRVAVRNAAPPAGPLPFGPGGGRGLIGLAERVRLAGGTLHSGPTGDGGFEVAALFPLPDQTLAAADPEPGPEDDTYRDLRIAQQRMRKGLIAMIALPVVVGIVGVATALGLAIFQDAESTLPPEDFAALRVGEPEERVVEVLPETEYDARFTVREPQRPEGARCSYYRSNGVLFTNDEPPYEVYRLCFEDGRLRAKDAYDPRSAREDPASEATAETESTVEPSPRGRPTGTR
ncbi:signal transduction histidine kinase [Murinocardiopsis flavida]|uniref:histidine kinase n=1 Tax=Murinocardiopsis flavida TaxID=645275 RepID=A0A2P8DGY4_9ACTN|nr:histidine kinase [Murinocardiopsis flavida]PSK96487.1 signal transduction histidine kinase [Murinocardiopsis flavida]